MSEQVSKEFDDRMKASSTSDEYADFLTTARQAEVAFETPAEEELRRRKLGRVTQTAHVNPDILGGSSLTATSRPEEPTASQ